LLSGGEQSPANAQPAAGFLPGQNLFDQKRNVKDGANMPVTSPVRPATPTPTSPGVHEILAGIRARLKVIAFDCDGVLFDSKTANIRFYDQVLRHFGQPDLRPDQEEFVHMHSARESLELLFGRAPEHLEPAWDYCSQMDFRQFDRYLSIEPGIHQVLEACRGCYAVALATNRTISTRGVLEHFGLLRYFDAIVTAADVARPKPLPDMMLRIMERFAVGPEEILFIGDSRVDAEFAVNTGVHFAAYKNPSLTALVHLDHFQQLRPLFACPDRARTMAHAEHPRI